MLLPAVGWKPLNDGKDPCPGAARDNSENTVRRQILPLASWLALSLSDSLSLTQTHFTLDVPFLYRCKNGQNCALASHPRPRQDACRDSQANLCGEVPQTAVAAACGRALAWSSGPWLLHANSPGQAKDSKSVGRETAQLMDFSLVHGIQVKASP